MYMYKKRKKNRPAQKKKTKWAENHEFYNINLKCIYNSVFFTSENFKILRQRKKKCLR